MNEKIVIADDAHESRRNLGSLRSGGLVGGHTRSRSATLALLGMGAALAWSGQPHQVQRLLGTEPRQPREKTPDDLARIEAARLKRERKAAKKSARTTTPNTTMSQPGGQTHE